MRILRALGQGFLAAFGTLLVVFLGGLLMAPCTSCVVALGVVATAPEPADVKAFFWFVGVFIVLVAGGIGFYSALKKGERKHGL